MLTELIITDFAIIDRLELRLNPHFNVFTGETGAGKSIIIDAVSALLGEKLGVETVRSGADRATVYGTFTVGTLPAVRQSSGGSNGANDSAAEEDKTLEAAPTGAASGED